MCLAYQNLSNMTFVVLLFNKQGHGLLPGKKEVLREIGFSAKSTSLSSGKMASKYFIFEKPLNYFNSHLINLLSFCW